MKKILGLKAYLILMVVMLIPLGILLINKDNRLEMIILFVVVILVITFFSVFVVIKNDSIIVYSHIFRKRIILKSTLLKVMITEHIGRGALHDLIFLNNDNTSLKYKILDRNSSIPNYEVEFKSEGIMFEHNIFPIKE